MRRLILMRHGKSDWPEGMPDFDRPLARRGREAVPRIGAFMAREMLVPDFALVSPARRTLETWQLLSENWAPSPDHDADERLYSASANNLLQLVQASTRDTASLLLVGHNPSLHEVAMLLSGSGDRAARTALERKFPTAALAVIEFGVEHWRKIKPGAGQLTVFMTPRLLTA